MGVKLVQKAKLANPILSNINAKLTTIKLLNEIYVKIAYKSIKI